MADPRPEPEWAANSDRGPTAGLPRWVKASGIIALAIVLLLYTQTLDSLADAAAAATLLSNDLRGLRNPSPTLHAAAAFLLVTTTLAMTPYGQRKQHRQRTLLVP